MINKALSFIIEQLNLKIPVPAGEEQFVLGNIALAESQVPGTDIQGKVVMSLVNVEEESTLKNGQNYRKTAANVIYQKPPVNINLYILFSANYPGSENDYITALTRLSQVIGFFQGNNIFTLPADNASEYPIRLIFELYTLTFEQINYLWGSLGGKQMPFVLYKARLIRIQDFRLSGEGSLIEEVKTEHSPNLEDC